MNSRHTCALSATEAQKGHSEGLPGLPRPLTGASESEKWSVRRPLRISRYGQTLKIEHSVGFFNTLLVLPGASDGRYRSCGQNLALVGPPEGFGHAPVEEGDELDQALAEVVERREARAA